MATEPHSVPTGTEALSFKVNPPPAAVMRVLSCFDRTQLEGFITVAIDLADLLDAPANPDEPNFQPCSDGMPGDPADHEMCGDEEPGAWHEWHRMRRKDSACSTFGDEDDEDDDPIEGNGDELDGQPAEDEFCFHGSDGPGCPIADPDCGIDDVPHDGGEDNEQESPIYPSYKVDQSAAEAWFPCEGRELMRPHRDRVREIACERYTSGGRQFWRFRQDPGPGLV